MKRGKLKEVDEAEDYEEPAGEAEDCGENGIKPFLKKDGEKVTQLSFP